MYSYLPGYRPIEFRTHLALLCWSLLVTTLFAGMIPVQLSAQTVNGEKAAQTEDLSKPISEEEAKRFALEVTDLIIDGTVKRYQNLIDWNGIIEKGTRLPESTKFNQGRIDFKRAFINGNERTGGMLNTIHTQVKNGGSYTCLRVNVKDKVPYAMFRLKLSDGDGLNYHQLFLGRNATGSIVITDIYVLTSGELLSDTVRRGWLLGVNKQLEKEKKKAQATIDPESFEISSIVKFAELARQNKFDEALSFYKQFPEAIRKDKILLLIRLRVAQAISDEEHAKAIDDFRKYHPDDIALDFLLIDRYILSKKYDLALQCVDRTYKNVGGDPLLFTIRATLLLEMDKVAEARLAIKEAIKADPTLAEGYTVGLNISIIDKNYDEAVEYLKILENKFELDRKSVAETTGFEDFVKSKQYQEWMKTEK